jgi:hypothetical protein
MSEVIDGPPKFEGLQGSISGSSTKQVREHEVTNMVAILDPHFA